MLQNFLENIFPNDRNGSRILITSRDSNVALKAVNVYYNLLPLSDEQSWELLCIKVFEKKSCPPELSQVGKQIAKNCKGLPFAVVSIAGVLKTTDTVQDLWKQVGESFSSEEVDNPLEKYSKILELCYQRLPNYLKPCFLYFGTFREDAVIPLSKLLRIWIAKRFILQANPIQNSLEYEAKNYLENLIRRSLVMVAQRSSTGVVKSCRVHDLVRDFCLLKAEKENFLLHLKRYDGHSTNPSDSVARHPYRLCTDSNSHAISFGTFTVRSLLFSFWLYQEQRLVNVILEFRLLRVLDLSNVRIYDGTGAKDFVKITDLVHLRFLAIPICHPEVPSQIMNLQNLETLIIIMIKRSVGITLPVTIWNLIKLRHLHVKNGHFSFRGPEFFDHFSELHNLETLSTIEFFLKNYFERLTSSLSGLRKLACLVSYILLDPLIISLNQVETLKLHFDGEVKLPLKFNPNSNLKKLTLLNFRRRWNEISIIGKLPNLEVLKLEDRAYVGRQWDMRQGEFENLKFLKLSKLDIQVWNASSDRLPCLQRLVLHSCSDLKKIPPDFGDIITLEYIEIKKYNKSVLQSLVQIEKQQRHNNNGQFKLSVFGLEMGSASSSQSQM